MPTSNIDLATVIKLAPQDAIDYLKAKGYKISFNWQDIWQSAHARSFTVAKAMRADILQAIRLEVEKALSEGITEREFIKNLEPRLKKLGWWGKQFVTDALGNTQQVQLGSPHRLKTIYRTNTQTAYMAGRYKQQMENSDQQPYWMYVAVMDSRTRPSHSAINGKVFRFDDPFWQTHYPPNGWGCRCRVRALSERRLKRLKRKAETSTGKLTTSTLDAGVDKFTGEIYPAKVTTFNDGKGHKMTPDKGWNHNVGVSAFGQDLELMRKLTQLKDANIRQQVIQQLNNSQYRQQVFATWAKQTLDKGRAGHSIQTLGFLDEALANIIVNKGFSAPSRVLAINEKTLWHANSTKHINQGIALSIAQYQQLPTMLASPQAVLWDKLKNNLLFIYPSDSNNKFKLVVNAPYGLKKVIPKLDVLVNAYKVKTSDLHSGNYELLQGKLAK